MYIVDQIRGFSLMAAMLGNRAYDPYCSSCNSFNAALAEAKDNINKFDIQYKAEIDQRIDDFPILFMEAKKLITAIDPSKNPIGQKKSGTCTLPEGCCYSKLSLTTIKKIP